MLNVHYANLYKCTTKCVKSFSEKAKNPPQERKLSIKLFLQKQHQNRFMETWLLTLIMDYALHVFPFIVPINKRLHFSVHVKTLPSASDTDCFTDAYSPTFFYAIRITVRHERKSLFHLSGWKLYNG